jgi:hypothetical protein
LKVLFIFRKSMPRKEQVADDLFEHTAASRKKTLKQPHSLAPTNEREGVGSSSKRAATKKKALLLPL